MTAPTSTTTPAEVDLFVRDIREGVSAWLEHMQKGTRPGQFRFCTHRSLVPHRGHAAQFVTCFAMKTAWHTGLWEEWPDSLRNACIEFVQSFQTRGGEFVDTAMQRRMRIGAMIDRVRGVAGAVADLDAGVRAETRQSAATLLMVGALPRFPFPVSVSTPRAVGDFVATRDWSEPWSAGSQTSHLVFFLHANEHLGFVSGNAAAIDAAFEQLDAVRDPASGTWFRGEVDVRHRLNGAMKVLTAYRWTRRKLAYAEQLLDYALAASAETDGCSFLNRLFVATEAADHCPGHRRADLESLALSTLGTIQRFRRADGAFSFFTNRAQRRYFESYVSLGGLQSDMHGTVMLTWATALCLRLLGLDEGAGWRPSTP